MSDTETIIIQKRTMDVVRYLKPGPAKLYFHLWRMADEGRNAVYATAQYHYRSLGCARSTYYRWRKNLEELGVVTIEERKLDRCWNASSLIRVCSLKAIAARLWARIQLF